MCSNTSHPERGQHSSNLRLQRRMGCLKIPENEEQTFPTVETMGESYILIYRKVLTTKCSIFPHVLSTITAPLHSCLGLASRSQNPRGTRFPAKNTAPWEIKSPRKHEFKKRKSYPYGKNIAPWCRCSLHMVSAHFEQHNNT